MGWNDFNMNDDQNTEAIPQEPQEPKKLIDSAATIQTMSQRTKELASKILNDADSDAGLARQITHLNISELNKAVSKETTYKTEDDKTDLFMNKILNHNDEDILKGVSYLSVSAERKKRYDLYEQMLDSNYLVFRILRAYINGILIKNAQTKSFLTVQIQEEKSKLLGGTGQDVINSYTKFGKAIVMKYKLQQKLQDLLIPKTLQYGNYFVEIVDLNILDNIAQHEQILMEEIDIINNKKKRSEKNWKNDDINVPIHGACVIFSPLFLEMHEHAFYPETFLFGEEEFLYFNAIQNNETIIYSTQIEVIHIEDASTDKTYVNLKEKKKFVLSNSIYSLHLLNKYMKEKGAFRAKTRNNDDF